MSIEVAWEIHEYAGWRGGDGRVASGPPPTLSDRTITVITVTPSRPGSLRDVRFDRSTSPHLMLSSISVAGRRIFESPTPIGVLEFSSLSSMCLPVFVPDGSPVHLVVENEDEGEHRVRGALIFVDYESAVPNFSLLGGRGARPVQRPVETSFGFASAVPGRPRRELVRNRLWRGQAPALRAAAVLLRRRPWLILSRALLVAEVDGEPARELEVSDELARWVAARAAGEPAVGGWCRRCCDFSERSCPMVQVGGRSAAVLGAEAPPVRGPCAECERALALWWRGELEA